MYNKIKTKDIAYLSSRMTGEEAFGYPMFYAMEDAIKQAFGCTVINPARHFNGRTDLPYEKYLRHDFKKLIDRATCVVVFGNWRLSKGSLKEIMIAQSIGLPVFEKIGIDLIDLKEDHYAVACMLAELLEPKESVCQKADRLVNGDRGKAYGHPYDDYSRTVELFNTLTGNKLRPDQGILFMICVKLSRMSHAYATDHLVDSCGYLKCLQMVLEKTKQDSSLQNPKSCYGEILL